MPSTRIAQDPTNAELYLKRGELLGADRQWKAALADYERAAHLDPELTAVDLCRGVMLLEAGQPQPARLALDRFLSNNPNFAKFIGLTVAAVGVFVSAVGVINMVKYSFMALRLVMAANPFMSYPMAGMPANAGMYQNVVLMPGPQPMFGIPLAYPNNLYMAAPTSGLPGMPLSRYC